MVAVAAGAVATVDVAPVDVDTVEVLRMLSPGLCLGRWRVALLLFQPAQPQVAETQPGGRRQGSFVKYLQNARSNRAVGCRTE